jgi:hypothetical protein
MEKLNAHTGNTHDGKNKSAANGLCQVENGDDSAGQFLDNRPEAIQMRRLQSLINKSKIKPPGNNVLLQRQGRVKPLLQLKDHMFVNHASTLYQPIQRIKEAVGYSWGAEDIALPGGFVPALPGGVRRAIAGEYANSGSKTAAKDEESKDEVGKKALSSMQKIIEMMVDQLGREEMKGLKEMITIGLSFAYDEKIDELGLFLPAENKIKIGPTSFARGIPVVYSTLRHELIHAGQYYNDYGYLKDSEAGKISPDVKADETYSVSGKKNDKSIQIVRKCISEIEAHVWEINNYLSTGVGADHVEATANKLRSYIYWASNTKGLTKTETTWRNTSITELKDDITKAKEIYNEVTGKDFDKIDPKTEPQ